MTAAYLHAILEFGHYRAIGNEIEEFALGGIWQWDDEKSEDAHLQHQKREDLWESVVLADCARTDGGQENEPERK